MIDRKIVACLQVDGRMTNAEIAAATGLSVSAANERVRRLQQRGVITGWTARVDPDALGLDLLAFVFLEVDGLENNRAFLSAAADLPEVLELHHVTGAWSYLLKVRTTGTRALESLISERIKSLPGVSRSLTHIALSSTKDNGPLPLADGLDG